MIAKVQSFLSRVGPEPFIWSGALVYLAFINPGSGADFTLCPLANLGFHHCPGCGLGHAVSYALHGDFASSIHAHWFGIPALLILSARIWSMLVHAFRNPLHHGRFSS